MPGTDNRPELTVVVPVFRNADRIAELAARVGAAIADRSYELLFVDDASPDHARAVVSALAAADARVSGIVLGENVGQNVAVVAGLAHADGRAVAVMDGDLQDPPEALPRLLDALEREEADVAFAARRGRYEPRVRLAGSRLFKRLLWAVTLGKVPPGAGLFLVARREVVQRVVAAAGRDPYVVALTAQAARSVAKLPVERAPAATSAYSGAMRRRLARRALVAALGRRRGRPNYRVVDRIGRRFGGEQR